MNNKLQQTIKEEIIKIPKDRQKVINSLDWIKTTEEIGKKYLLNDDNITNFQTETMLVLFGLEDPSLYEINVRDNVVLTEEKAKQIVDEAVQKIFIPINNVFIANIKKSGRAQNADAAQNLNFILSGGDYSAFLQTPSPIPGEDRGGVNPPRLNKEGVGGGDSPHPNPLPKGEGVKPSTPFKPDPYREIPEGTKIPVTPTLADIQANMRKRNLGL